MYDIERKEKILEILKEKKSCSVAYLARTLCFSEATIRRDLNDLDKQMKLKKTFGGAVILEKYGSEVSIDIRRSRNVEAKARLAEAASAFIKDDMTIFLAASTTTELLVPYLLHKTGITVITNHPDIPGRLSGSDVTVYSTGGKYLHHSNCYMGEFARNMIRGINADLMLMSCRGISADGRVTNSSTDEDIYKTMIENSDKVCLIADSTKFGKVYPFTFCRAEDIDYIITDKPFYGGFEHGGMRIV